MINIGAAGGVVVIIESINVNEEGRHCVHLIGNLKLLQHISITIKAYIKPIKNMLSIIIPQTAILILISQHSLIIFTECIPDTAHRKTEKSNKNNAKISNPIDNPPKVKKVPTVINIQNLNGDRCDDYGQTGD